jgi:hypothetical protein
MSLDIWLTANVDLGGKEPANITLYDNNYTHNVVPMWEKAFVYDALYNSNGKLAEEILQDLKDGVEIMEGLPDEFIPLNPKNGWGDYYGALKFLKGFTDACERYPKSTIGLWK